MRRREKWLVGLVGAVLAVAITSVGIAADVTLPFSGEDGNTINGCFSNGGNLKVLTPSEPACPKGYQQITWNVEGPQGLQGPQGIPGPQGVQGIQGPPGPSGSGPVYYARNEHVVYEDHIEIVGLSDLPAGSYVFTATIGSRTYFTQNGAHSSDILCFTTLNGPGTNLYDVLSVAEHHTESLALALTVPAGSKFTVRCSDRITQGDDAALAVGWVIAQRVTAINP